MAEMEVLRPGLFSVFQDRGRVGVQKYGVPAGGAMDELSMEAANALVGNNRGTAVLEMTISGPTLQFSEAGLIAVCGGDFEMTVNGKSVPLWRPIFIAAGTILRIGHVHRGCRLYLAVAGGFQLPETLGSASTYVKAGFGGWQGRPLQQGDRIALSDPKDCIQELIRRRSEGLPRETVRFEQWGAGRELIPRIGKHLMIRAVKGMEYEQFSPEEQDRFWSRVYTVRPQSDRMGVRLRSADSVETRSSDMVSESVMAGTVQVPADGQPIILMKDCQTSGGYPRIAQIIAADLPVIGQLSPGVRISLRPIPLEDAEDLYILQQVELEQFRQGVQLRMKMERMV